MLNFNLIRHLALTEAGKSLQVFRPERWEGPGERVSKKRATRNKGRVARCERRETSKTLLIYKIFFPAEY